MSVVIGFLACICWLSALPIAYCIYKFFTTPPHFEDTTQTGELYYAEIDHGDGGHLPLPYIDNLATAAISDAVIIDDIQERKARIAKKRQAPTLTPKYKKEKPKPIRSLADREDPTIDYNLEILN